MLNKHHAHTRTRTAFAAAIVSALALTAAAQAHAELQTWRLEANIDGVTESGGWLPPAELFLGKRLSIDYTIDLDAQDRFDGYAYHGAATSLTFNGVASDTSAVIALAGLGLNASLSSRPDGVNFVSFNNFAASGHANSLRGLLNEYSLAAALSAGVRMEGPAPTEVRLDFGDNRSIYATPLSFTVVPEPGTAGLMLLGLAAIPLLSRQRKGVDKRN